MKNAVLFFFFCCTCNGQNRPIEITIDAITSVDPVDYRDREFTIVYHIKNVSDHDVSFFLNPKAFLPSIASSMQYITTYRFYQNETPIDVSQVFTGERRVFKSDNNSPKAFEEFMKTKQDSIKLEMEKIKADSLYAWKRKNNALLNAVYTLKPKEVKQYTKKINWNKQRYVKSHDIEYYFDEKDRYFIELELTLMKKEYQDRLSKEELETIMKNPNFIKGNYKSNKVEINFKD